MKARKTVVEPRSEYVMVRTTKRIKERLQILADERSLSLSLMGHLAFKAMLEMSKEDEDDANDEKHNRERLGRE